MTPVAIESVGLCAPGVPDWRTARVELAAGARLTLGAVPRLTAGALPPTERRRANGASRWALEAAADAVRELAPGDVAALATVFASADGDGEVLCTVLRDLAQEKVLLSPTTFHNSVFNAPAGYWSLAAKAPSASTTICAAEATVAQGLVEAATQVALTHAPVLLVAYDLPFPAGAPIGTRVVAPFACALRLAPDDAGGATHGRIVSLDIEAGGGAAAAAAVDSAFAANAAACALPLLVAIASRRESIVRLPWLDGDRLEVRWTP